MIKVIPAILEKTLADIQKRVAALKKISAIDMIQLDVMDGEFVPNTTFQDPAALQNLDIKMEAHLMIARPELVLRQWLLPNISRIIVHQEAVGNMAHMIEMIRDAGKEVAVAINPGTSTYTLKNYVDKLDMVLVMGVEPGFSGQKFHRDVLEKIKEVKKMRPQILVEVDGGVDANNRNAIVEAGADILVAGSYIWNAGDIKQAIKSLQEDKKA